ncbi:hypothetical protein [Streptomyces sp. NPDC046759]|uniref:hypothetical protein n=1 Tax=Streptomyces sp. NPDC046759 TaxID=3155019 RepID=UPI0033C2F803
MADEAGPGLVRVVYVEQSSALMMGVGAVLSEGLLLALIGAAHRLETLLGGTVAVTLVCLVLLPLGFQLPARLRRKYEHAAQVDHLAAPHADEGAARRRLLRRTAGLVGAAACWMMLIGLVFHEVMPPVMLVPMAMTHWARSRATADWEQVNGAALWQGVPGLLGTRGPVFRVPADYGT